MTTQPPGMLILTDGRSLSHESLYQFFFEQQGYDVSVHSSPLAGALLEQALLSTPDIIVVMHADAFAICAELRAEARLACCPIVVQGREAQKEALLKAGAAAFFSSAVEIEEVRRVVARLLAERVEGM